MTRYAALAAVLAVGFFAGYKYPRDVELESTSPVVFTYEITESAAMLLARKHNDELSRCRGAGE